MKLLSFLAVFFIAMVTLATFTVAESSSVLTIPGFNSETELFTFEVDLASSLLATYRELTYIYDFKLNGIEPLSAQAYGFAVLYYTDGTVVSNQVIANVTKTSETDQYTLNFWAHYGDPRQYTPPALKRVSFAGQLKVRVKDVQKVAVGAVIQNYFRSQLREEIPLTKAIINKTLAKSFDFVYTPVPAQHYNKFKLMINGVNSELLTNQSELMSLSLMEESPGRVGERFYTGKYDLIDQNMGPNCIDEITQLPFNVTVRKSHETYILTIDTNFFITNKRTQFILSCENLAFYPYRWYEFAGLTAPSTSRQLQNIQKQFTGIDGNHHNNDGNGKEEFPHTIRLVALTKGGQYYTIDKWN